MIKRCAIVAAGAIAALTAQPALAQDEPQADLTAELGLGPLTEEQQERLPLARRVIELVMPDGATAEIMRGVGSVGFVGIGVAGEGAAISALSESLGYAYYNDELEESKAERALNILNPAWRERQEIEAQYMQDMVRQMWAPLEPIMREAMTELYAIHFTQNQLEEIEAFYQTDTGQVFARQSVAMASDPRLAAAIMQTPSVFENYVEPDTSAMEEALAALPQTRTYDELSERERALLGALLGLDENELRETMSASEMNDLGAIEAAAEAAAAMEAE